MESVQLKPSVSFMKNLKYMNGFVILCSLKTVLPLPLLVSKFDILFKWQLGNQKKNQNDLKCNSAAYSVAEFGTEIHRAWKILYFQKGYPAPKSTGCCAQVAPTMPSGTRSAVAVPPAHFAFAETTEVAPVLFLDALILIWGVAEL